MSDREAMPVDSDSAYLVVNADDYGYFRCVSKGILSGASDCVISATGIMANGADFDEQVAWLSDVPDLDVGVHLNLTYGKPLSRKLASLLGSWHGEFPDKFALVRALVAGKISIDAVVDEWRAQIRKCIAAGLTPRFLNSHEHTHMFPPLYRQSLALAEEFSIAHVRFSMPEWQPPFSPGSLVRNLLMQGFVLANRRVSVQRMDGFLGMAESGNISLPYLEKRFEKMQPGGVYELMCHPGQFDAEEIQDVQLLDYHSWESELDLLRSSGFRSLCERHDVKIAGYRDLEQLGKFKRQAA